MAGTDSAEVADMRQLTEFKTLPDPALSVRYRFLSEDPTSPVRSIELTLADGVRQAVVEGSDDARVDALRQFLLTRVEAHSTYFGGLPFRIVLKLIVLGLFGGLVFLAMSKARFVDKAGRPAPNHIERKLRNSFAWAMVGAGLLGVIIGSIGNSDGLTSRHFPGAAVFQAAPGFIERYGAAIGFWSGLIGFAAILWAVAKKLLRQPSE
jgi:hypothetical protein